MKFDAIIIGFGKGGKTLAGALAKQGKEVALIERSRGMYGGTCINVGCIPSKLLVSSAAASELAGGGFEEKAARYAAAVAEKRRVTALLRGKNYSKLNELPKVSIFDGVGSFAAPIALSPLILSSTWACVRCRASSHWVCPPAVLVANAE